MNLRLILWSLLLFPLFAATAYGKLAIQSPKEMLDGADVIITAVVTERQFDDDRRSVVLELNKLLKGSIDTKQIRLEREKPGLYGWGNFDFPEAGSQASTRLPNTGLTS